MDLQLKGLKALLATEKVTVEFTPEAVREVAFELGAQLRHARIFRRNRRLLFGGGLEGECRAFGDLEVGDVRKIDQLRILTAHLNLVQFRRIVALRLFQPYRVLNLFDGEAGNFAAVIAAELLERRDSAMSSAEWARSRVGGEIIMAVRRKNRGIDIRITVGPEADAVTPDGVVVDIVDGEWPKQRPDPSVCAVAVSPPAPASACRSRPSGGGGSAFAARRRSARAIRRARR